MSCDGWYYLGTPTTSESMGITGYTQQAIKYKGPVKIKQTEWAYGTCKLGEIQGAAYTLNEKPEVKSRVSKTMKEMQEKTKKTEKTKPLTVINLFLDSMSRKTFYRRLTKTIQFLNELDPSLVKVYDFKLHSSVADNTLPNLFPMWTGKFYQDIKKSEMQKNKEKFEDLIYNISIWKEFKDKGWVTLFGVEFCNNYFAYGIGRTPKVDHLMAQFWCGARGLVEYSDTQREQRCFGQKRSHEYLFSYLSQYVHTYQGLNKWAHIMCVTAHEDSGTVIETLDDDLVELLYNLTRAKDEFVIFMGGDHGMRYGQWYRTENGGQEHRLPLMLVLASSSLIESVKYSDDVLTHNSNQLMNKRDIYFTLQHLAMLPYDREFGIEDPHPGMTGFSLLRHKIPDERKCQDAGNVAEYCPCNDYNNFDPDNELMEKIALFAVDEMNKGAVFNTVKGWEICQYVKLNKVEGGKWVSQSRKILARVSFTTTNTDESFEALVMIFGKYMKAKPHEEGFEFLPFYLGGKRLIRLLGIRSKYTPVCRSQAWSLGILPELCICKP